MQELLSTFHVDWKLLIAQLVNFAVVMVLITYVVIRPLRKMMAERAAKIQEGIDNAVSAEVKLSEAETAGQAVVASAESDAHGIRAAAHQAAEATNARAAKDLDILRAKSEQELEQELERARERDLQQFRQQSSDIALQSVEKLLKQKFSDGATSREYIANIVK